MATTLCYDDKYFLFSFIYVGKIITLIYSLDISYNMCLVMFFN